MNRIITFAKLLGILLATTLASTDLNGQGSILWDQQRLTDLSVFPGTYFMLPSANPVGQQFTPTLSSLTAIGVVLGQNDNARASARLQAFIHEGSDIFGRVIGSSMAINLGGTASGAGFIDFTFSTPVPLVPGSMYVFEIRHSSTDPYGVRYVTAPQDYGGGKAIVFGNTVNADLVFREGTSVPEPSAMLLLSVGGAAFVLCSRRTRSLERTAAPLLRSTLNGNS